VPRTVHLLVTIELDDKDHRPTQEVRDDIERELAGDAADVVLIATTDDGLPPATDPAIIERDTLVGRQLTAYLAAVMRAMMHSDPRIARYLSPICPECGKLAHREDGVHVVLGTAVVVGCEGYWVINPNAVGISSPNWQPQP
jgi:hypothetical protein